MSGHSKWSTIKRKKGAADQQKGKIFTRCAHEIGTAVREGGGPDPAGNPRLRLAIDKAKTQNMPNDNIDRAIKRASGELKGDEQFEIKYEGYGPGGVAVLVESITDNKNRTVSEVRHCFSRHGGTLGENGCVSWMFSQKGLFFIDKSRSSEESLMELALEHGAEDISDDGELWEVKCSPQDFIGLQNALENKFQLELAEIQMVPSNKIPVSGTDAEKTAKLLQHLEDLEDVMNVYTNADFEE